MLTLAAFIVALLVVISIHECGHYVLALYWRVRVIQFSIGFGRPLLKWHRQQPGLETSTEFTISALPLGGFVKMHGDKESPSQGAELESAFDAKPLHARASIVLAGPMINLLLAVLIYASLNWLGEEKPLPVLSSPQPASVAADAGLKAGDQVHKIRGGDLDWQPIETMEQLHWATWRLAQDSNVIEFEVTQAANAPPRWISVHLPVDHPRHELNQLSVLGIQGPKRDAIIREVLSDSPAAKAGLMPGDLVLSVDGRAIEDAAHLTQKIRASSGIQHWTVQRPGVGLLEIPVSPELHQSKHLSTKRIGAIVGGSPASVWMSDDFWRGWANAFRTVKLHITLTLQAVLQMFTSQDGWKQVSGPLSIAEVAGKTAETGLRQYLGFIALLSLSVGVLNLLPIPMLDGGHVMYYLWEAMTGKQPSMIWQERLRMLGFIVIFALIFLAFFNDFLRLIQ
jgi:regulator of sigma E protease